MTAQQKQRVTWAAVLGGIAAAATIGSALVAGTRGVARAAAAEQVSPVRERVKALEVQRADDKERLERMERKIDRVLERIAPKE